jgi:Flp pilus assembly protein TadG
MLKRTNGEGGQVVALLALALVALLAGVALVVDGGNAFAQQRVAQNGSDAASQAGAVVLMQRLAGVPGQDGDAVHAAVAASATANGLVASDGSPYFTACYTNIEGIPLTSAGATTADCTGAALVEPGQPVPPCSSCPSQRFWLVWSD